MMDDGLWGLSAGATDIVMAVIALIAVIGAIAWLLWVMVAT